jgi:hypothetical protein
MLGTAFEIQAVHEQDRGLSIIKPYNISATPMSCLVVFLHRTHVASCTLDACRMWDETCSKEQQDQTVTVFDCTNPSFWD